MAMEYLHGRTLSAELKQEGPLPPGRAVYIAREITRALRAAHRIEVVHRDLKPANVMLGSEHGEEETVKVLDFGLVKVLRDETEELTQEGRFLGSPKYMAPEQIRRAPVDGRTDLYALGVILYQMLSGRVPFRGEQSVQTLMAHLVEEVPPLSPPPGVVVPPALEQLVMRCLEKDRTERPASADEVLVALETVWPQVADGRRIESSGSHDARVLEDEIITVRPPSESGSLPATERASDGPTKATLRPPPRRPALWVTLAVVALAIAGAMLGALGSDVGEEPADEPVRPAAPGRPVAETDETRPRETPAPVDEMNEVEEVATPPPAPRTFRLTVESEPEGAVVFRDAAEVGRTPLTLELDAAELEARAAAFSVRRRGYESYAFTQVASIEDVRVTARLRRIRSGGGGGDPLIKTQR
jgi:serine/threonine-protein kinase